MRKRAATFILLAFPFGFAVTALLPFDGPVIDSTREVLHRALREFPEMLGAIPDSARLILVGAALMIGASALRNAAPESAERENGAPVRVPTRAIPIAQPTSPTQGAAA